MERGPRPGLVRLVRKFFPEIARALYAYEIVRRTRDCRSCLDVGCGPASFVRFLGFEHLTGVEGHPPSYDQALASRTHDDLRCANVTEVPKLFHEHEFDCVLALDLIEHLHRNDAVKFLSVLESIAARKVILFTPNGFLPQRSRDGDLQEHLSGWTPDDLRSLGYTVIGMHGPKWLRGEEHRQRIRPKQLGGMLSLLAHLCYTRRKPERAAALFAVKDMTRAAS